MSPSSFATGEGFSPRIQTSPRIETPHPALRATFSHPNSGLPELGIIKLSKLDKSDFDGRREENSQRRIDRLCVFLLKPRDQFRCRQNLGDAADALA